MTLAHSCQRVDFATAAPSAIHAAHLVELVELREAPLDRPHETAMRAQLDKESSVPAQEVAASI